MCNEFRNKIPYTKISKVRQEKRLASNQLKVYQLVSDWLRPIDMSRFTVSMPLPGSGVSPNNILVSVAAKIIKIWKQENNAKAN